MGLDCMLTLYQERPYHDDSTASRLLSEVKHRRAQLVLRWGTTLESWVLLLPFSFFPYILLPPPPGRQHSATLLLLLHDLVHVLVQPWSQLVFSSRKFAYRSPFIFPLAKLEHRLHRSAVGSKNEANLPCWLANHGSGRNKRRTAGAPAS